MDPKPKAVSLLSGGLDSSVALALALRDGWDVPLAVTFDYGQRAAEKEISHAREIAKHFGVSHRALNIPWLQEFKTKGELLKSSDLPSPKKQDLEDPTFTKESARAVWVPNRNGLFIEIAAGFAEDLGASAVIVGFNREEAATFPDNSKAYLEAVSGSLFYSTRNGLSAISPTVDYDKTEIIQAAEAIDFPFSLLWSCYQDGEKMCGTCESCMRLKRAYQNNEVAYGAYFKNASL